jgi:hypothetical protein
MKGNGMNVLSYFITEYGDDRFEHSSDWTIFKKCYGNDCQIHQCGKYVPSCKNNERNVLKKIKTTPLNCGVFN